MKRIGTAFVIGAALSLQGCFAVIPIPGPVMDAGHDTLTGERGNNCIPDTLKVGDHIRLPNGSMGTITEISGRSTRCVEPGLPIRATITAS